MTEDPKKNETLPLPTVASKDDLTTTKESTDCCDKVFACGCCRGMEKVSDAIIGTLEKAFYWLGYAIGKYHWIFILSVFVFVLCFLPGIFTNFQEETDPTNLWTPLGITARDHKDWVDKYYSSSVRFENMVIEAKDNNILTPAILTVMLDLDQAIKNISKTGDYSWDSLCAKLVGTCWSNSILELWSFDDVVIRSLTQADILAKINSVTTSPVYYSNFTVENVLGQITRDVNGTIISAKATSMSYFLNVSDIFNVPQGGSVEQWEKEMIDTAQKTWTGVTVYIFSGRSFGDEAGGAILGDINLLSAGYIIVILFVCVALGKYSCIQHKIYVTLGGICCIGLSIAFTLGLCSYCNVAWGPLHNVLPFLVLGIGVDDMFVIVQCWDNLSPETHTKPIHERIGLTMKHAGMSITITSITDILAFAVGATTILPALRSFCIYCSICILANFIFQATMFTACLAIDQRRAESSRNACCCCYVHKSHTPMSCHDKSLVVIFFEKIYSPFLMKLPVKIVVAVTSLGLLAGGLYGATQIKQYFDEKWFLPTNSYLTTYFDKTESYFPSDGLDVGVYFEQINYYSKYTELESVYNKAVNDANTQTGSVSAWFYSYRQWLVTSSSNPNISAWLNTDNYPANESSYMSLLNTYLFSVEGNRFIRDVIFENSVIVASRMTLKQTLLTGSSEQITAMDSIRAVCDGANLGGDCFAYSNEFLSFEGNRVIQEELFRNLGLAFLCIVIMTLLLLANIWGCFLVSLVVFMSLTDVMGFMYFWDLTIDTVTTINLIIAIGLTVDYSAHIAHTFMTEVGSRNERVMATLSLIGPAVFHGGFSTFLAFILLSMSNSYVFTTFFKIFLLVVIWGLFHGLAVLPVILSWVGPPPYLSAQESAKHGHKRQLAHQSGKVDSKLTNGETNPGFDQESGTQNGHAIQSDVKA